MMRFLRNVFIQNWALKLFSFILALVLWLTLIPEEKVYSERTLAIPLETYNIPRNLELVAKPSTTIDVTVRAPLRLIGQISPASVQPTSVRLAIAQGTWSARRRIGAATGVDGVGPEDSGRIQTFPSRCPTTISTAVATMKKAISRTSGRRPVAMTMGSTKRK